MRRNILTLNKHPKIWVLVADSKQAQIYMREKVERLMPLAGNSRHQFHEIQTQELVLLPDIKFEAESIDQYDLGHHSSGTVFESASPSRSMHEPHRDPHEKINDLFARTIAQQINSSFERKSFDRLVLIAPPKMLNKLKQQLSNDVLRIIAAEIAQELTHFDKAAILQHLHDYGTHI